MNIGIDCWPLTNTYTSGCRTQIVGLLQNIPKIDNKNSYVLFFDGNVSLPFNKNDKFYKTIPLPPPLISRKFKKVLPKAFIWLNYTLPLALKKEKIDLCFYPLNFMPIWSSVPGVIFIHDMGAYVIRINNRATLPHQYFFRLFIPHSVRKAKHIGVPSFDTKNDIIRILRVKEEKIKVIHHGIREQFKIIDEEKSIREVREKFSLGPNVLLYVGHLDEERENPFVILKIFSSIIQKPHFHSYELAVVGELSPHAENFLKAIENPIVKNKIKILGVVKDEEMVILYNIARLLLFPSIHEGFGFPMMEAMACGTPVIASNTAAIPEVAGDAAILLDPNNTGDWTDTACKILTDRHLYQDLRAKGLKRVESFSIERMSRETVKVLNEAINRK